MEQNLPFECSTNLLTTSYSDEVMLFENIFENDFFKDAIHEASSLSFLPFRSFIKDFSSTRKAANCLRGFLPLLERGLKALAKYFQHSECRQGRSGERSLRLVILFKSPLAASLENSRGLTLDVPSEGC